MTRFLAMSAVGAMVLAGCAKNKPEPAALANSEINTCGCVSRYEAVAARPAFGASQAVYDIQKVETTDPATGQKKTKDVAANAEVARKLAAEAAGEALANVCAGEPKLLWVFDRTNLHSAIQAGVSDAVGERKITTIVDGSYWPDYGSLGPKAVSTQEQQSVVALAIGGNIDVQTANLDIQPMKVKDWEINKELGEKAEEYRSAEKAKHAAWGEALAGKFDYNRPGTKVLILMGTMHVPRHQWVLDGVSKVIPDDVYIVGGSQADFGWAVYDGTHKDNTIYGILLSGDFAVAQRMAKSSREVNRPTAISQLLEQAKAELGGEPMLALYFGCAGWNREQAGQYEVLKKELPNTPFFGRFNGGELGRYTSDGPNCADAGLASIMLIGPKK